MKGNYRHARRQSIAAWTKACEIVNLTTQCYVVSRKTTKSEEHGIWESNDSHQMPIALTMVNFIEKSTAVVARPGMPPRQGGSELKRGAVIHFFGERRLPLDNRYHVSWLQLILQKGVGANYDPENPETHGTLVMPTIIQSNSMLCRPGHKLEAKTSGRRMTQGEFFELPKNLPEMSDDEFLMAESERRILSQSHAALLGSLETKAWSSTSPKTVFQVARMGRGVEIDIAGFKEAVESLVYNEGSRSEFKAFVASPLVAVDTKTLLSWPRTYVFTRTPSFFELYPDPQGRSPGEGTFRKLFDNFGSPMLKESDRTIYEFLDIETGDRLPPGDLPADYFVSMEKGMMETQKLMLRFKDPHPTSEQKTVVEAVSEPSTAEVSSDKPSS